MALDVIVIIGMVISPAVVLLVIAWNVFVPRRRP
jgi:hypothetical protein